MRSNFLLILTVVIVKDLLYLLESEKNKKNKITRNEI